MSLVKVEFVLLNGEVYQQKIDIAQAMEVMTEDHFVFTVSDDDGDKKCSISRHCFRQCLRERFLEKG